MSRFAPSILLCAARAGPAALRSGPHPMDLAPNRSLALHENDHCKGLVDTLRCHNSPSLIRPATLQIQYPGAGTSCSAAFVVLATASPIHRVNAAVHAVDIEPFYDVD